MKIFQPFQSRINMRVLRNTLIIFILLLSLDVISQDRSYITQPKDTISVDSLVITSVKLEKILHKLIHKNVKLEKQFLFVHFSEYKNILTDTIIFEISLEDETSETLSIYKNIEDFGYTRIDGVYIYFPYYRNDKDNLFLSGNLYNSKFVTVPRKRNMLQLRGDKSCSVYAFYFNRKGKLICKKAHRVFVYYKR